MFHFEATMLGHLFFGLSLFVFVTLFIVKSKQHDFFLHLLLLLGLGMIFYAADMITLFIGWEIMGWSSYFILAKSAQKAILQKYIIFNLAGAFSLLGAIVLIYSYGGSMLYEAIDASAISENLSIAIALLLLIAIFVKSGVMPLHHWMVDSYEQADDLFSALLSAILSKAGIFVFILFFTQILKGSNTPEVVFDFMAWMGVLTSIVATFKAINENEMKRLLAYSSMAQLGYIITVLALLNSVAIEAALYHTLIHTLVKLLLFVNIATVIAISGRTAFSDLGALIYKFPLLFVLLVIGIIVLAGMPLLGGFNSKFLIYTSLLSSQKALLLTAVMFSSASAFLYCYKLVYGIYLGQPSHHQEYLDVPKSFYIPQVFSAVILVVLGILPALPRSFFNEILLSLGLEAQSVGSLFELSTPFASFNGGVLMAVFGTLFVLILLGVMRLSSKAVLPKDRLDISYCGEVPHESKNLHYGFGMGEELRRISFIGLILRHTSARFWSRVSRMAGESSGLIQSFYKLCVQNVAILILLFFTLLLMIGVA